MNLLTARLVPRLIGTVHRINPKLTLPSHQITWKCTTPFRRGSQSFYRGLCASMLAGGRVTRLAVFALIGKSWARLRPGTEWRRGGGSRDRSGRRDLNFGFKASKQLPPPRHRKVLCCVQCHMLIYIYINLRHIDFLEGS